MIIIHENGRVYRVITRGAYSHVKSEARFRRMLENAIASYESRKGYGPGYVSALKSKSLWEVCQIFGIITQKWDITKN
jgi:hypothetical protein